MPESFLLPVSYRGEEREYPAELLVMGYTHKIRVTIGDMRLLFEPDEERFYRAVTEPARTEKPTEVESGLLQAISETLHELFT